MPKRQSQFSVDDVLVPVDISIPEGANPETILDVVQFQFVPGGLPPRSAPVSGGWVNGFWLYAQRQLLACCRIGPGTPSALPPGSWAVWIKVIDNPTSPVAAVDQLVIY
jgi:hypothetical protein